MNNRLLLLFLFSLILSAGFTFVSPQANAQPNCTNHTTNNGNGLVTFNVENTNSDAIIITEISSVKSGGGGGNGTWTLLYNPTAVNSTGNSWTQGTIGAGQNGWVQGGQNTINLTSTATPQTVITGMNITVPAGATYGFCLSTTGLGYMTITGTGVNVFSSGGVNLKTGDNISWGGGVIPATPANYPRGFNGCITWIATTPCTGQPAGGIAVAGDTTVCPATAYQLSVTGSTVGANITYQWQSAAGGSTAFTNITGATSSTYSGTSLASDSAFRRIITCTTAGLSDTSTVVTITLNSFIDCYCTSNSTSTLYNDIFLVQMTTLFNSSNCTSLAPGPGSITGQYSNYSTLPATDIPQGVPVPFTVEVNNCGTFNSGNAIAIYIDLNHNGFFTDVGEQVYLSPTSVNTTPFNTNSTFTIPGTAMLGQTRMRIINVRTTNPFVISPCGTYTYGETEDYLVNVVPSTPCAGTPATLTASATPASVCENTPISVTASGASGAVSGYTYQLQSAPSGSGMFANIGTPQLSPGFTVATQSVTTDYQVVIYCTATGDSTVSSIATVMQNLFYDCYCVSTATSAANNDIFLVQMSSLSNASTCTSLAPGPGSVVSQYSNYATLPATPLPQGTIVPFTVQVENCATFNSNNAISIYIDFNHNGFFTDVGEQVYLSPSASNANPFVTTGTFVVPVNCIAWANQDARDRRAHHQRELHQSLRYLYLGRDGRLSCRYRSTHALRRNSRNAYSSGQPVYRLPG